MRERGEKIDLEVVVVLLLSSSEGVQPNFGVAQGREEVVPCSRNQMGTFLEHRKGWSFEVRGGYSPC